MTTPDTETIRADKEAAEKYADSPGAMYPAPWNERKFAFLAGIQHGRSAERERILKVIQEMIEGSQHLRKLASERGDTLSALAHIGEAEAALEIFRAIRAGGEHEGKE